MSKKIKLNNFKAAPKESSDESSELSAEEFSELDSEVESGSDSLEELGSEVESDSESDTEASSEPESEPKVVKDKFLTAVDAILGSKVKKHDQDNPILIRNRKAAKDIEDAKEDAKARKALKAERLLSKDKARVRNVIPKDPELAGDAISKEKTLRKIAQRGVVKMMNAINAAQNAAIAEAQGVQSSDMSKEKFLDMLRMG